jgi:hypothetical protein
VRTLKYESYEERRQAAKEWLATEGKKYMRPLGKGRPNYLSSGKKGKQEDFSLATASQGQEGVSEDAGQEDPWEDGLVVRRLKQEHDLSDQALASYRQRHEGLTPAILTNALSENLGDAEIAEAIQADRDRRADEQFNVNEVSRAQATKVQTQQKTGDRAPRRDQNMHPFPLNPTFQSQPVLSEELREIIYLKVVRDELSVRTVSTLMGVSMERVGAVVRMKQMERDWVQKVSPPVIPRPRICSMMIPFKNRLVFKTPTWLQTSFASLSDQQLHPSLPPRHRNNKQANNIFLHRANRSPYRTPAPS